MNGTWHTKVLSTESNAEFATSPSSYYRVFWLSGSLGWACRVPWPQLNNLLLPSNCNAGGLAVEIPVLKSFSVPVFPSLPPQFLRSSTQITWGALFRHEVLSRDPLLLAMIPKYLRASMTNLVKVCGNDTAFYCLLLQSHLLDVSSDRRLLFLPDVVHSASRWAFPLKQTAPVVNTPDSILTAMRTSMPSSTVSCPHPTWMLLCVPFLLRSAAGWAWRLLCWFGSFQSRPDSFSLNPGAEWVCGFPVTIQAVHFTFLLSYLTIILHAGQVSGQVAVAT